MTRSTRIGIVWALIALAMAAQAPSVAAKDIPEPLPDPASKPPDMTKPVKVYILLGQSNMVGMGDISGGSSRWGNQFLDPVVSVYPGTYSPTADYDNMTPSKTKKLEKFGGVKPTPYPGGGTQVVRGHILMPETGVYRFKPGYGGSTSNIMEVDGKEVHRREVGKDRVFTPIKLTAGKKVPFKITYLTDAANGLGWVQRLDIPGTLETLVKREGKFPHLIDDEGQWTVRNDVMYKGVITARGKGPLTVGLQGNTIGPELQFGHIMGNYHDEPVLLIKSSQGNRSLGWDFLPPGSKRFEYDGRIYAGYKDSPASWEKGTEPKPINWYAGKQYDDCVGAVHEVLEHFAAEFPPYKDQGYEIAGFVWWQGHKDGGSKAHICRYEQNLVRLIESLRKEFTAPKAPFAIATVGFGGRDMGENYQAIWEAQMAVSDPEQHPKLAENVATVDIRDFWRSREKSPSGQGYHYNRNAETYMLVGDALGRAMVHLKTKPKQ